MTTDPPAPDPARGDPPLHEPALQEPGLHERVRVLLFVDLLDTVVDWRGSIISRLETFGRLHSVSRDWPRIADDWRAENDRPLEQVRSGVRTGVQPHELHRETLASVIDRHRLGCFDRVELSDLGRSWSRLETWPDVDAVFPRLGASRSLVCLCRDDGSLAAATSTSTATSGPAGLGWDEILNTGAAPAGRPRSEVYRKVATHLGREPAEIMVVAGTGRELDAAAEVGCRTALVTRRPVIGGDRSTDPDSSARRDIVCCDLLQLAASLDGVAGPDAGPGGLGLGAPNLTRVRLLTLAAVIALTSAMAFSTGYRMSVEPSQAAGDPPSALPDDPGGTG